jgi:D-cysteine desulfhydrase
MKSQANFENRPPPVEHHVNSSPEINLVYAPALFFRFPKIADQLPWVSLRGCEKPSAPVRLNRSQHFFGENYIFVKRESLDFHILPDNKARKLEFVLGDALRRKRKKLVTFGYVGSSHCLATVKAASENRLKSEVVLLRCPLTADAIEMIAVMKNLGATVRLRNTMKGVLITAAWKWLCSKIFRTELIPPGGSNGLGTLGYVSAMVELKNQIDDGEVPAPDYIFVAAGSGSTLVGMEIGKRLLGLDSIQIIGVQTSDDRGVSVDRLVEMGNAALEHLSLSFRFNGSEFTILKDYVFGGHGQTNSPLNRWMAEMIELEGLELDPVYTAKALYGMKDYIERQGLSEKKILFWNTYGPFRRGDLGKEKPFSKLSRKLKRWIKDDQAEGRLAELGRI